MTLTESERVIRAAPMPNLLLISERAYYFHFFFCFQIANKTYRILSEID